MWTGSHVRNQGLLKPLLAASAVLALALGLAILGSEVSEGETRAFDMAFLLQAKAFRAAHPGFSNVMRDISGIGSTTALTLMTVATCGYLWLDSEKLRALLVAASIAGAALLMRALKLGFGRMRPDGAFADFVVNGPSFPSGHASMSTVVFLTLGAMVASTHANVAKRIYILSTAAIFALAVGASRVALGVHWATDVLGGWAFGAAWVAAWLFVARGLSRRQDRNVVQVSVKNKADRI